VSIVRYCLPSPTPFNAETIRGKREHGAGYIPLFASVREAPSYARHRRFNESGCPMGRTDQQAGAEGTEKKNVMPSGAPSVTSAPVC
jgi:hypothetical protein